MAIAEQTIDQINERLDIVALVGAYVRLKPRGANWWGCCPFHQEKTPSFSVNPEKKMFYCFGCQAGGSAFKFLMEIEKLNFAEAVERLADQVGVEVKPPSAQEAEAAQEKQSLKELYQRICASFEYCLWSTQEGQSALHYLQQRGIDQGLAQKYRLGYAPATPSWLYHLLRSKGYSTAFLTDSGLFSSRHPQVALFVDRLLFPICDKDGQVIAYSGRQLKDRGPKYINSPDTIIYHKRKSLFGLPQAWAAMVKTRHFFLCEGNFDVLAMVATGFDATLAPLGTALTLEQLRLLQRHATNATLVFDGDNAGLNAIFKAAALLERVGIVPRAALLEVGSDPAQLLFDQGREFLRHKINQAVDFHQFFRHFIETNYDASQLADLQAASQLLAPIASATPSALREDAYLDILSQFFGVSRQALAKDMEAGLAPMPDLRRQRQNRLRRNKDNAAEEVELMLRLIVQPAEFERWQPKIEAMGLNDVRALFLYQTLRSTRQEDWPALLSKVEIYDPQLAMRLVELSASARIESIDLYFVQCQRQSLLKQRREIEARLVELDRSPQTNWQVQEELLREQASVNQRLAAVVASGQSYLLLEELNS